MEITINTVKYLADIETPNKPKGYLINGKRTSFIGSGDRYEVAVGKWISDGNIPEAAYTDLELTENVMSARYVRLEQILNSKATGLKRLAIDKPFMNDPEAINNQYRIYEEMYKNALAGRYDTAANEAIILANETVKTQLAELTLLISSVRSVIEHAIASDAPNTDDLLNAADAISLTKEEITPEKIVEIKTVFGL